jgi:hypothetical protein
VRSLILRKNRGSALRAEARTDFAAIESNLEFIMSQLARVPTRKQLARYSLLVMVGTACLVQTLALLFR